MNNAVSGLTDVLVVLCPKVLVALLPTTVSEKPPTDSCPLPIAVVSRV